MTPDGLPPWYVSDLAPSVPSLVAATTWRCMLQANRKARLGKPKTREMDRHELDRERVLLRLQATLRDGTWRPAKLREFHIADPKPRQVAAAPLADRIVQHVLMAAAGPRLDAALGPDVFANRKNMGTHAALRRYCELARRSRYVLKLDVAKYFGSIDHAILLSQLRALLVDTWVLPILSRIVHAARGPEVPLRWFAGDDLLEPLRRERGLPLGNLTSQTLANLYLAPVDAVLRSLPGVNGVVRYVDDLAVFSNDRATLRRAWSLAESSLATLRLGLAQGKCGIAPVFRPSRFLGQVVSTQGMRLPGANRRRFARRFGRAASAYKRRLLPATALSSAVAAWMGHARHGMSDSALSRTLRATAWVGRRRHLHG
jgi:RNA-directed DNA polymerase